ncbi:hypothetical protein C8J56DRAFT_1042445 [Mycena floridula]|nr:hypothetical protein C8J56DRAFT_1042445 [Mycena floridula]
MDDSKPFQQSSIDGRLSPSMLPTPDPSFLSHISNKKSHARKQPLGHVPRPRNAFIIFRSLLVHQNKVPSSVQNDHCSISRLAGVLWRQLTDEQRLPWMELAEKEKEQHAMTYPNYRYIPRGLDEKEKDKLRNRKREFEARRGRAPVIPASPVTIARRSSSCPPPGAEPVAVDVGHLQYPRDDLARRPSSTTMYHSVAPAFPVYCQGNQTFNQYQYSPTHYNYDSGLTFPWSVTDTTRMAPPLTTGPYRMALPRDGPGWDAPPPTPAPYCGEVYVKEEQEQGLFTNPNPFSSPGSFIGTPPAVDPLTPSSSLLDSYDSGYYPVQEYFHTDLDALFPRLTMMDNGNNGNGDGDGYQEQETMWQQPLHV